jgi:ATP-dependent Clp protease ATP-binding subunit ClpC
MFEKFTDRARRVIVLAQEEARLLSHDYIGTEHLLLGLIHEGKGVAARALESLGISLEDVRRQVEEIVPRGQHELSGHIPFTPRAKKVLELSLRESQQLGHDYIGTEHILLGLIREGEGVAAQVLVSLGADLDRVRQQVLQLLGGRGEAGESEAGGRREAEGSRWQAEGGLAGSESEVRIVGSPAQLAEILARLRSIDVRLAAVQRHLGLAAQAPGPAAGEEPAPRSGPAAPPEDEGPAAEAGPERG